MIMKNMKVKDIVKITNGKLVCGDEETECINFSKDTRIIQQDDTYIGIKGEKFDGNQYWKEALEKGAKCVIVQDIEFTTDDIEKYKNKIIIKVKDTLQALYRIASFKRDLYNIPVVAITGSVGKTSTKDIISNVVAQKYKVLKTIGNNNNNIGLPFTILRLKDEEVMILEMGMNHFGEISLLSKIAKPDICVITNIGTSHIGNLGSRENILKAKLEILDGSENPTIIINNDNDLLHNWYEKNKSNNNIQTYGIDIKSDINPANINLGIEGSTFECDIDGEKTKINVPVAGEHFILNAMSAILVGKNLNLNREQIKNGIETFELTKKRMDIFELSNGAKIINDAYNASFESMQASLRYLANFRDNRKIAVLGDMFELGEFSKELHKNVGTEVFKNNIDILICGGENAKDIVAQAEACGMNKSNIYYFENKDEIIEFLKNNITNNDVILFKASNGMKFFELADKVKEEFKSFSTKFVI